MDQNRARLTLSTIENTQTQEDPRNNGISLSRMLKRLKIKIVHQEDDELVMDIKGIEAPLANALRRAMISEVSTMAIEDVDLYQNTSTIPDEVLAHRMGLIPIAADPRRFQYKEPEEERTQDNCITFKLHKKCYRDDAGNVINEKVYSGDLEWIPIGNQMQNFQALRPVHPDILIAQLGPGQEIEMFLHCEKGRGGTHAKWSPVATAYYRLLPDIRLTTIVADADAQRLVSTCPVGVFDIEDGNAVVKNPRICTSCRECIRHTDFVDLGKRKDHFICKLYIVTIESVGQLRPLDIFKESLQELRLKAHKWLGIINKTQQNAKQEGFMHPNTLSSGY